MRRNGVRSKRLYRIGRDRIGKIWTNGVKLEQHEYETVLLLAEFGFDIEFVRQNNIPKTHNADIFMLGTNWEMKSPESANLKTLKKRFHKASLQATHVIFDFRRISRDKQDLVKRDVLGRFKTNRNLRRIILIFGDGDVVDYIK